MAKISREIRLPVNAIAGMSELALRENIPTPAREYITEIRDTGFSLLKIIDDIVDFTNIETGELELKPAPYSVVPLIKSCIEICRLRITERGLRFNIDIDEKLPSMLIGDENRIKQIIFNLLTNAAKYTSEGSVTFSVAAKSAFNRIILTIRVEDSGIGMTEEQAAVVFGDDRDESAESWIEGRTRETKDRRIHGIGLGLSISRELCRLMGGSIGVKSTLGEGTAFTVELPQDVSDSRPIGQVFAANANEGWITAPVPEIQAFFPAWTAAKAHILVIDDMMTNLKIMKNLLKPYRCTVYQCLTGNQAVEQVGNDWYDLVFLEHEMTGLDGIETVETIRRLPIDYAKAVPIIALSSDVVPGTRESYIARGFNDYLSKPVRMTSLNEILEKWIPDRLKERTELGTPPV
jgi:CheY-like chemotaxis protein